MVQTTKFDTYYSTARMLLDIIICCMVITLHHGLTYRQWVKVSVSLTTIMGLTWIVGVLVFHSSLVTLAYIFTIFVAFQVSLILSMEFQSSAIPIQTQALTLCS